MTRARELGERYLATPVTASSVRWVDNQRTRWGSCTPLDASIRLSSRLQGMPGWVVDYVLLHELAHLVVPGHGKEFWAQLARYPHLERARAYLEGVAFGTRSPSEDRPGGDEGGGESDSDIFGSAAGDTADRDTID